MQESARMCHVFFRNIGQDGRPDPNFSQADGDQHMLIRLRGSFLALGALKKDVEHQSFHEHWYHSLAVMPASLSQVRRYVNAQA